MKFHGIIGILFFLVFFGCTAPGEKENIEEAELEICLGEYNNELFDELIKSFEDFLVRNHYAENSRFISAGIKRYLEEIQRGTIPFDSLEFDLKKNSEMVEEMLALGFIEPTDRFGENSRVDGKLMFKLENYNLNASPYFNPFKTYLPCLKSVTTDSTSFEAYYLKQKEKYGDINIVIMASDIKSIQDDKPFESKIIKEIIIIEFYVGLVLRNTG